MAKLKSKDDLPDEILIALEELEKLSLDPNMRMEALNKEMWIRDQIVLSNMAKNAEIDGYTRGKAEGDLLSKYEIVKKMKTRGSDLDFIADITGLDLETIEKL